MMPYILQVTVTITVCFLFYKALLQKETFYRLNRWTLMTCLAVSFTLPFLPAPHGWSWRENYAGTLTRLLAPPDNPPSFVPHQLARTHHPGQLPASRPSVTRSPATRSTATGSAATRPAANHSTAIDPILIKPYPDETAKTAKAVTAATISNPAPANPTTAAPILLLILHGLFYCYLFGVILFAINFLLQLAVLWYQSKAHPAIHDGRFRIVEISGNRAPCSFGNNIFINPALYDPETYQQILIHEKIHVSGRHTLDILLAEIAVVLQWFNPFVWLYRREVENNLEFLTDQSVLLHRDVERSAYQLSLLRVTAPHLPFSITNNYNQSRLKKRIVMMNSRRSSQHTVWKYFFLLPVLTILVCALNKPAVFGQTATTSVSPAKTTPKDTTIRPATSPARTGVLVRPISPAARSVFVTDIDPQITVETDQVTPMVTTAATTAEAYVTATAAPAVAVSINTEPFVTTDVQTAQSITVDAQPISVSVSSMLRTGSWFATTEDGKIDFELRSENDDNRWQTSFTVEKSELNPFPGQGTVEFKLVREAGTMIFKGQFDGQQGFGHFEFQSDPAYFKALKQSGVEDIDEDRDGAFFTLNIKKEYVAMLQRNGYTPIQEHQVISLSAMHIDEDFMKYWKGSGIEDIDQVHNLITLKAMHIDPQYVQDLKAAGFDHLAVHQLVSLKAQHIDGQYVRSMNTAAGGSPITPEEMISFKAMHIDSGYLASLKKVGYGNLERHEIISFQSMHITADFIKGFQDAGYANIPAHDLISFKSMGITPDFAKSFRDLGYDDIEPSRLHSLKAMGITPDFVKDFNKIGFDHIPVSTLTSLKAAGVTPEYVAKMKGRGFDSKDLNKYLRLKRDFE